MMEPSFALQSDFEPAGDQPTAIAELVRGVERGDAHQVLLGATGTGKTFTIANVIQQLGRPTLILAPNKTLAAQLFGEFKQFFPRNAVHFFVSYYDYYQPEAYVPSTDTFIEKDALINEAIDRLRHASTRAVLERRDLVIVASVSCIYGLGDKGTYQGMVLHLKRGERVKRDKLLRALVDIQYERNDYDFHRGTFRVRGDVVEIFPTYEEEQAIRLEFWGDELEAIHLIDPLRGKSESQIPAVAIFPASHYVTPPEQLRRAIVSIQVELGERLPELRAEGLDIEAQRLAQRTLYDVEMLEQIGFCQGIENYSRHLTGRAPGDPPPVLLDYFPDDLLMVIDESHVAIPQLGGMFRGDRSRKQTLVNHGFRLPSALDNRPLKFEEFQERAKQVIYLSATPGDYEMEASDGVVVEQLIRPTWLVDPAIDVRPATDQVDDLLGEIRARVERGDRVLVTTLTKRMAEDLTEYYEELGIRVRYLHSDIDTLERVQLLADLRLGVFDVLIGINLLREGLDLPEVSLVAILDADKEGFLRSTRSLIQTIGRAARHLDGQVILYGDRVTRSMAAAIDETDRRRGLQETFNEVNNVTPRSVRRRVAPLPSEEKSGTESDDAISLAKARIGAMSPAELALTLGKLRAEMKDAADRLAFEEAASLRDRIRSYEGLALGLNDVAGGGRRR